MTQYAASSRYIVSFFLSFFCSFFPGFLSGSSLDEMGVMMGRIGWFRRELKEVKNITVD